MVQDNRRRPLAYSGSMRLPYLIDIDKYISHSGITPLLKAMCTRARYEVLKFFPSYYICRNSRNLWDALPSRASCLKNNLKKVVLP